jgi:hypothetical protein
MDMGIFYISSERVAVVAQEIPEGLPFFILVVSADGKDQKIKITVYIGSTPVKVVEETGEKVKAHGTTRLTE